MRTLIGRYLRGYLAQVTHYTEVVEDDDFALHLDNTDGPVNALLQKARGATRAAMLDGMTSLETGVRMFKDSSKARHLSKAERRKIEKAFEAYLEIHPREQAHQPVAVLRRPRHRGDVRVRHRQRRAAGVQRARRGLQPVPRQRRGAVDEAGERAGGEPLRRHQEGGALLRARGSAHRRQPARPAVAHRPQPRLHDRRRGRVRRRRALAVRDGPRLGPALRADRDRPRRRAAGPGHGQGALRLRRGQRPVAGELPGRGGHQREPRGPATRVRRRTSRSSASTTPRRVRRDHALFVDAFRNGQIGIAAT